MKVLLITCDWPTKEHPERAPFLVNEIKHLRSYGIEIDIFHFSGKKNPIKYLIEWIKLRQKYKIRHYDVIHAEWGQSALLSIPKRTPLVITFRGGDLEGIVDNKGKITLPGYLLRWLSRRMASIADQVVLVSDSLSKYIPGTIYHLVPVCLDTQTFKPIKRLEARKILNLDQNKKLILFPANPDRKEKRYSLAKEAVELLGGLAELLVTRDIPHDQMPYYFNACDAMVITSIYEGSPTVVYEALACNLPIVSVDVGDVRSRLGEIPGCYICEEQTPQTIADALKKVLLSDKRVDGFEKMQQFNNKNFCIKMHQIYSSCLQR